MVFLSRETSGVVSFIDNDGNLRIVKHAALHINGTSVKVDHFMDRGLVGASTVSYARTAEEIPFNSNSSDQTQNTQGRHATFSNSDARAMHQNNLWRMEVPGNNKESPVFMKTIYKNGLMIYQHKWDKEELTENYENGGLFVEVQTKRGKMPNYRTGGPYHGERVYNELIKYHVFQNHYMLNLR